MKLWTRNLFAAVVVAGFVAAPARAADADPLLPKEAQQVFRVNLKQVLESDIIKKYALGQIKQMMEGADAKKMLTDLGLDPLKDIDTLSGGMWTEDPNDPKTTKGLVVLRGKFDPEKLFEAVEKAIKKDGDKMSIVKEGDTKLIKIVVDQLPEPLFASMADNKTILLGTDKKLVLDGIKAADTKAKPALKAELVDLIKAMDDKASMYFCGLASGKIGDIPPNPIFDDVEKLKSQLEKMVSSSMTLRVTGDVTMDFSMLMKDNAAADDLGGSIKELLDKVRVFLPLIAQQAPQAKAIVDDVKKSLKSDVKENGIKVSMKLTGDAIGKAVGTED